MAKTNQTHQSRVNSAYIDLLIQLVSEGYKLTISDIEVLYSVAESSVVRGRYFSEVFKRLVKLIGVSNLCCNNIKTYNKYYEFLSWFKKFCKVYNIPVVFPAGSQVSKL
ncbi:MAG: hypothetical protein WBA13_18205 [Microcoleaceae cyanobacterium]